MGSDQLLARLPSEGHDREVGRRISTAHADLYSIFRERLTPLPGARDLLQRCADQGLTVVLASSAKSDDLRVLWAALDVDEFITAAASSTDAEESQPEPGILQEALESSALKPADVVYVGDSVWDVEAAGRLGISCVGLECGGTGGAELTAAGASAVYADPAELLASIDDSPLGQNLPPRQASNEQSSTTVQFSPEHVYSNKVGSKVVMRTQAGHRSAVDCPSSNQRTRRWSRRMHSRVRRAGGRTP